MVKEAVEKKQKLRLTESSFKTSLETGKFRPGCLSEKVRGSEKRANERRGRSIQTSAAKERCLVGVLDVSCPALAAWAAARNTFGTLFINNSV